MMGSFFYFTVLKMSKSKVYKDYYEYPIPFDPTVGLDVFSEVEKAPYVEDVDYEFKLRNCYNSNTKIMKAGTLFPYTEAQLNELKKCSENILYFICNYCKVVTLQSGIELFKLYQYQKNAIKIIKENRFSIFKFPRQMGKGFTIQQQILTKNGIKTVGRIQVGDIIYGQDGKETKVIHKTNIQTGSFYRIYFDTDEYIDCDENHDWYVYDASKEKYQVYDTKTLVERLEIINRQKKGMFIDHCEIIDFDVKPLLIDPYTFGVWIGDGNSLSLQLSGIKEDYDTYSKYITLTDYKAVNDVHGLFRISQYEILDLKKLNVHGNKHIPHEYIFNSRENRIALIQGMMDTDGHIEKNGTCRFYQKKKNIVDSFRLILSTLGIKSSCYSKEIDGEIYWTVCFVCNDFDVVRIPRKLERQYKNKAHKKNKRIYIQRIEKIENNEYVCIQVDNDNHLFLVGNTLIPTHNCVVYNTEIDVQTIDDDNEVNEFRIPIGMLYDMIETENLIENYVANTDYEIYTADGFKDFDGITTKIKNQLLEIVLDGGNVIQTTSEHEYILQDGRKVKAGVLEIGDYVNENEKIIEINTIDGEFEVCDVLNVVDNHSFIVDNVKELLEECANDGYVVLYDSKLNKNIELPIDKALELIYNSYNELGESG